MRDTVVYPAGTEAATCGNFPGVTTETATKRDCERSGSLPAGEWQADVVGYATVAESYTGVIEVEYLAR